jgi:hypothetical protein
VLLVKPVTFMNNSGESVAALAKFYRVPPGRVLVISDDLDQPVAKVGGPGREGAWRWALEARLRLRAPGASLLLPFAGEGDPDRSVSPPVMF